MELADSPHAVELEANDLGFLVQPSFMDSGKMNIVKRGVIVITVYTYDALRAFLVGYRTGKEE